MRLSQIQPSLDKIGRLDAIAARGGPLKPIAGGVYRINEIMLSAYRAGKYANHASNLAALIANEICIERNVPAYIVDPITTDEFTDVARISGVPGIERKCRSHALNIKYCSHKAAYELDIPFKNSQFIVAHLGSGFSIAAVETGRIIDVNDALLGMGPFSIQRAGALPISGILDEIYNSGKSRKEIEILFSRESGLKGYLGTNQCPKIEQRIIDGDEKAKLIVDAMINQIVKEIGGLHAVFEGHTSALIISGGLAHSDYLINKLKKQLHFI